MSTHDSHAVLHIPKALICSIMVYLILHVLGKLLDLQFHFFKSVFQGLLDILDAIQHRFDLLVGPFQIRKDWF